MLEASIRLARELPLVGVARHFVDQTVTEWRLGPTRNDAVLITSELSANAVLHGAHRFPGDAAVRGVGLRIEVRDQSGRIPSPAPRRPEATSGRGLAIVGALAKSWGSRLEGAEKVVWAEIGPEGSPADGA